ncbi:hypothetical protein ELI_1485 [Eubacterium callanderi]|nr:hypothetical protein ELI_1485 [Eubacterium callanderi]
MTVKRLKIENIPALL